MMKKTTNRNFAGHVFFIVFCFFGTATISGQNYTTSTDPGNITAFVDVTQTGAPVNRYVYGMFTELLGNIFDHGLWAEMLSDRKFFYPVDTTSELNPVNTRRFRDRWRPVGGFVRTLYAAERLQEMFRHSDIITMGGYTAVTSCVNFNTTDACLSSIGMIFKLYRDHFGTLPLNRVPDKIIVSPYSITLYELNLK